MNIWLDRDCVGNYFTETQLNEIIDRFINASHSYGMSMRELDEVLQRVNNICEDDLCRDDFGEFQPSDKPIEFLLGIPANNKGGM